MILAALPTPTPEDCDSYVVVDGQKICDRLVGISNIADVINIVMAFIFPLAGVILFFVLVWGGFEFLTSAGNPEKVKSAQAKITSALIGFFILVFAYAATRFVTYFLGFQGFF